MHGPDDLILAREHHPSALARAVVRREIERIRPGAYVEGGDDAGSPHRAARRRRALIARAVHLQLRADHTFSGPTAALLWGCALWRPPERTHVNQAYRPSSRAASDLVRHAGSVPAEETAEVEGLPVTGRLRTLADCALWLPPLDALVIADSARRLWPELDLDEALDLLARRGAVNGRRRARWVLEHADGGADSPWETWVRYVALRVGLPRPRTQAPVSVAGRVYRCDVGWPEHEVYVEFDGRVKYTADGMRPGHDPVQELLREKRRADDLADVGVRPVRVMAGDAPRSVESRVLARFPAAVRREARVLRFLPPADR